MALQYFKSRKWRYIVRVSVEDSTFGIEAYLFCHIVYIHSASCTHLFLSQVTLRICLGKFIVLLKMHKIQQKPA